VNLIGVRTPNDTLSTLSPEPIWTQDSLLGLRRGATLVELSSTGVYELLLSHLDSIH